MLRLSSGTYVAADANDTPAVRGPLCGIPFGVKDIIDVARMPTAFGLWREHRKARLDAWCVSLLRAAGAVPVGKTRTTAQAWRDPAPTMNPLDADGTYPLPLAQMDRFLMKIVLDYPTREEERRILERFGAEDVDLARGVASLDQGRGWRAGARDVAAPLSNVVGAAARPPAWGGKPLRFSGSRGALVFINFVLSDRTATCRRYATGAATSHGTDSSGSSGDDPAMHGRPAPSWSGRALGNARFVA